MPQSAVWVYRHPDCPTDIVANIDLLIVGVDDGASYDGEPHNHDEALIAAEQVVRVRRQVRTLLRTDPVRIAAEAWADEMGDYVSDYITYDEYAELKKAADARLTDQ